jgi:hypothetical protein|tara:strand:+ start:256 stop:753 length:498 start_codon:yes stop_codon:yes gene_type:complete
MAFRETSDFDMPIPGMALTHELGARPWQTPPEMSTFEEGLDFYVSRIVEPKNAARLLDIIETGIPLTAIAETLTLGGAMQGLHTIDVAVLVNPVLVELMEGLAKNAEVKYTVGDTDGEELPDDALLAKAMASLSEIDKEELKEEMDNTEVEAEKPKGLMARRGDM